MTAFPEHRWKVASLVTLIVLLGGVLRLFAFAHDQVINSDGLVYIQQAKALHYGLFHLVTFCNSSVSIYPFLIETGYRLFGDWVLSARVISLFAGTLVLIPFYGLLRRFHDPMISSLALLVFAVNPSFVAWSHAIIRDPVFWVFLTTGIYLFVLHIEELKGRHLLLGVLCFLSATCARVEAVIFVLVTFCYLMVIQRKSRLTRAAIFTGLMVAFVFSAALVGSVTGQDFLEILRLRMVADIFSRLAQGYTEVREHLACLVESPPAGFSPYFFSYVRNLTWLIALGTVVVYVIRAFFLPFFVLFLIGITDGRRWVIKDPRLLYLSLLSGVAFLVLYGQVISTWGMFTRFAGLFLLPSFVFVGFGLNRIADYFVVRLNASRQTICLILCLVVLGVSLPKSLTPKDESPKSVFKEIGEYVASREPGKSGVFVKGNMEEIPLVNFYANRDRESAECYLPDQSAKLFEKPADWDFFLVRGEERGSVGLNSTGTEISLVMLKEWRIPDGGPLTLYKVRH